MMKRGRMTPISRLLTAAATSLALTSLGCGGDGSTLGPDGRLLVEDCGIAVADGITVDGPTLPIPPGLDGGRIDEVIPGLPKTGLAEGVRMTMEHFALLRDEGRLDTRDLEE